MATSRALHLAFCGDLVNSQGHHCPNAFRAVVSRSPGRKKNSRFQKISTPPSVIFVRAVKFLSQQGLSVRSTISYKKQGYSIIFSPLLAGSFLERSKVVSKKKGKTKRTRTRTGKKEKEKEKDKEKKKPYVNYVHI